MKYETAGSRISRTILQSMEQNGSIRCPAILIENIGKFAVLYTVKMFYDRWYQWGPDSRSGNSRSVAATGKLGWTLGREIPTGRTLGWEPLWRDQSPWCDRPESPWCDPLDHCWHHPIPLVDWWAQISCHRRGYMIREVHTSSASC